jgi:hypothetical protein
LEDLKENPEGGVQVPLTFPLKGHLHVLMKQMNAIVEERGLPHLFHDCADPESHCCAKLKKDLAKKGVRPEYVQEAVEATASPHTHMIITSH